MTSCLLDGIDETYIECITSDPELFKTIFELKNDGELIDPCDNSLSADDMINEALSNTYTIQNSNLNQEFLDALIADRDIITTLESFTNCEYAKCLFDKLINTGGTTNCSLIEPLMYSNINYELSIDPSKQNSTIYESSTGKIKSNFVLDCEGAQGQDLELLGTFVHEFIHAEIINRLLELNLDPNNMESFSETWDNYFVNYMLDYKERYSLNDINHAVMIFAENSVDQIAKILWELNEMKLTKEHYYHIAWGGLRYLSDTFDVDPYGINSPYYNLHLELKSQNPNLTLGCN